MKKATEFSQSHLLTYGTCTFKTPEHEVPIDIISNHKNLLEIQFLIICLYLERKKGMPTGRN